MIAYKTVTIPQMGQVVFWREVRQHSWDKIAQLFTARFNKRIHSSTIKKHYSYAMTHGFSAWTEYPEGN